MEILVTVFVFIYYILYFLPPMWREDIIKYMLVWILLLLKTLFFGETVLHKNPPLGITVQYHSPHVLSSLEQTFLS